MVWLLIGILCLWLFVAEFCGGIKYNSRDLVLLSIGFFGLMLVAFISYFGNDLLFANISSPIIVIWLTYFTNKKELHEDLAQKGTSLWRVLFFQYN